MYIVTGTSVHIEDTYKPHGVKMERYALLREDVFDILVISAAPSLLPWTTERETFLRQFYPSFPIPSNQYCTSFPIVDTSSITESSQLHVTRPMNQIIFKPSATNTLSSLTFQTDDMTTNHSLQHASSILDPKLLPNNITIHDPKVFPNNITNVSYRQLEHVLGPDTFKNTSNFWTHCFKLLSDSAEVLENSISSLNEFLVNQKTVSKQKILLLTGFCICYYLIYLAVTEKTSKFPSNVFLV